jgi:mRNA-degrading endonuclease RelE of RelBE toxin-antitoxin system
MAYALRQTRRFARAYKKLHDNVAADVDKVSRLVAKDPFIGEQKKGDLADLFVYKFRSQNQLYLIGYTIDQEVRLVYLEAVGPHENFYRDIKRSGLRSRLLAHQCRNRLRLGVLNHFQQGSVFITEHLSQRAHRGEPDDLL